MLVWYNFAKDTYLTIKYSKDKFHNKHKRDSGIPFFDKSGTICENQEFWQWYGHTFKSIYFKRRALNTSGL